jgi:hypothetical protein
MPSLAAADVLGDGSAAIKDLVVVVAEKQDRGDGVYESSSGISRGPSLPMAATVEFDVPKSTPQ